MTRGSPTRSDSGSGWRSALLDPAVAAIAAYALVAMGAAVAAYFAAFTIFHPYDDEGTLLLTLQAFAQGDPLYRDIYSPYGPFYYELFGGLLALSGHDVTTETSRATVVVLWVATSFLVGIATQRLTGRLALGVTGMIAAFATLNVLPNEPMHPQGLCVLLLAAFVALAVFGPGRHGFRAGALGGVLLAALFLTKINLGAFALAALALAAVLVVAPLRRQGWLRWLVVVGVLALPAFIALRDFNLGWVRELVALETLSIAAVVVAAWPLGTTSSSGEDEAGPWLLGAVLGFGAAFVALMGAIVVNGSSPADVYDSVVTEATRVRDVVVLEFSSPTATVDWALASVAAAVLLTRLSPWKSEAPSLWPGLLRAAAGLGIWFSVAGIAPVGLGPSAGNPLSLALVLAWVAAIPPAAAQESSYRRFLRVLLPALAVIGALQVYPVAGSQVGIASLSFVPVGALVLADALTSLRAWSASRGGRALERFGVVAAVALTALAADFTINAILRPIGINAAIYRNNREVPFPGTGQLRLPPAFAEEYTRLVDLLERHRCTDFIGYPNVNSLYLWSGIEPPPPVAPGAWIQALDSERQQRIVDELRRSPRPCAIRNDALAAYWLREDALPNRPLVNYVLDDFRIVDEVAEFKFMLPVERGAGKREPG